MSEEYKYSEVEQELSYSKKQLSDAEKDIYYKLYNWNFVYPNRPYKLNGESIELDFTLTND